MNNFNWLHIKFKMHLIPILSAVLDEYVLLGLYLISSQNQIYNYYSLRTIIMHMLFMSSEQMYMSGSPSIIKRNQLVETDSVLVKLIFCTRQQLLF